MNNFIYFFVKKIFFFVQNNIFLVFLVHKRLNGFWFETDLLQRRKIVFLCPALESQIVFVFLFSALGVCFLLISIINKLVLLKIFKFPKH